MKRFTKRFLIAGAACFSPKTVKGFPVTGFPVTGLPIALACLVLLGGCGREGSGEATSDPNQTSQGPNSQTSASQSTDSLSEQGLDWTWTESHRGDFWCAWKTVSGAVEMGPSFPIELRIAKTKAGSPIDLDPSALAVDARMPDHDHGMLQRVELRKLSPGHYRVDGMRLHMIGYWELHVDLIRPPFTERAQFVIEL